jgi:hypothetical protein
MKNEKTELIDENQTKQSRCISVSQISDSVGQISEQIIKNVNFSKINLKLVI